MSFAALRVHGGVGMPGHDWQTVEGKPECSETLTEASNDVAQIEAKLRKDICGVLEQLLQLDSGGSHWK